tara:strand:- start:42 stop:506 length:465 start_codon:yes stop_codon:yes gene_type:complete
MGKRMIEDKLDELSYLEALVKPRVDDIQDDGLYYNRQVSNGVTVRARIEDRDNEVKDDKALERKRTPVYSGVLSYFPDALKEVSKSSLQGQKQHNHGEKLYWDKNKSTDNEDAMVRHLIDHSVDPVDDDGVLHLAKVAWRALASLQIYLDNQNK